MCDDTISKSRDLCITPFSVLYQCCQQESSCHSVLADKFSLSCSYRNALLLYKETYIVLHSFQSSFLGKLGCPKNAEDLLGITAYQTRASNG